MKTRILLWCSLCLSFLLTNCQNQLNDGTNLMNQGKYQEAISKFLKVDSTSSDFKIAKRNIAQCYLQLAWQQRENANVSLAYYDSLDIQYIDTQNDTTYSNYMFYSGEKLYESGLLQDAFNAFDHVSSGSNVPAAKDYLSRLEALAKRAAQIQQLRAIVGDPYPRHLIYQSLPIISKLHISKDMGTGSITIQFHLACTRVPEGWDGFSYFNSVGTLQFRVRLFDRNSNYLTHLITERFAKLLDAKFVSREGKDYSLAYEVNMRDLRDTEIGEIAIVFLE